MATKTGTLGSDSLQGTAGADSVFGAPLFGDSSSDLGDLLSGLGGNDSIFGAAGNDTLAGGAGDDWLDGGLGIDEMAGGTGDDTYVVNRTWNGLLFLADSIMEKAGEGTDTVITPMTNYSLGSNFENLEYSGSAGFQGTGNGENNVIEAAAGNDTLNGQAGNDTIRGFAGNDELTGGTGADRLVGGVGNDQYFADDLDAIIEAANGGYDQVIVTISSYTLDDNLEELDYEGFDNFTGSGNELDNGLSGDEGNDLLIGLGGDDTLFGFIGIDTMMGGTGNDVYIVMDQDDVIEEDAGGGYDVINLLSVFTYIMPDFVDKLVYSSSFNNNTDITGNSQGNWIEASDESDTLAGRAGNDRLFGFLKADTISGGLGQDTLIGGEQSDQLRGNGGEDVFEYNAVTESGPLIDQRDVILDFVAGDRIDVSTIDAKKGIDGNQAFTIDSNGSFSKGEIRFVASGSDLIVEFNNDADAAADMAILVKNVSSLTAADFIL